MLDAIGCHIEIVRNEIEPNRDEKIEETKEIVRICFPWITNEIMESVKEYYRWRK